MSSVTVPEIVEILRKQSQPEFADLDAHHLEQVQERAFHLHYPGHSLFLKWIPNDDECGRNEISANREVLSGVDIPAPHLLFVIEIEEAALAGWEWLDGSDLREQHRELLPAAFARLGSFHAARRQHGAVCSPLTHRAFDTIQALLRAEAAFLCSFYNPANEARCVEIFSLLETGYPTFIHGDMHPGNIRFTSDGLKFVDWGYALPSLNLFDLGYVQSIRLNANDLPWWNITPAEAEAVLPAYFTTCGMEECDYRSIHQAVMLWSELWSHYNCVKNGFEAEKAVCRRNIDYLLYSYPC